MRDFTMSATVRKDSGKGVARRLRNAGHVPAVVYSGGNESTLLSISPKELTKAVMGPFRRNQVINLDVEGSVKTVMVRELQKHPVRRTALHVDFVEVKLDEPVVVKVPFAATGRSKPVIAGGKIEVPMRTLRVRCLPNQIPERIEMDTTSFEIGVYRAKEVSMPEGSELLDDGQLTVVTISRGRGAATEDAAG